MSDSDLKKYLKEQRAKVRTQMEFYFSDSNLAKDRFLKQEIQASKEGCWYFLYFHLKSSKNFISIFFERCRFGNFHEIQ